MADHQSYLRLLNYSIPDREQTWAIRDTILYALGVGLGIDPLDTKQLYFVYESELRALPTMIAVLCAAQGWVRKSGTEFGVRAVAGEFGFTLHRPIPVQGEFFSKSKLVSVIDKGAGKGALLTAGWKVYEKGTGELLASLESTTFCRGDGGFGGPKGPVKTPHSLPVTEPQFVCDLSTIPQAALIYRLSGDLNILHADPESAKRVGFTRPILHGLCTFGVAGHALLRTLCDYDPSRLKSMQVRFSAPVYPGELLRTEMWINGANISFRTVVPERDNLVVLDNGIAVIA